MKNKKNTLINRLFSSNIALFIFALFLSFASWIVVSYIAGNDKPFTIENVPITISLPDSQSEYQYFLSKNTDSTPDTTDGKTIQKPLGRVYVTGNAFVVGSLDPEEFKLVGTIDKADSNAIVGLNKVSVSLEKNGTQIGYKIEDYSPETLDDVYIDKAVSKSFAIVNKMKVSINSDEDKKDQYVNTTVSPAEVNVKGPETIVNKIKTVEVHGNIPANNSAEFALSYYDENGDKLADADTAYLSPEFDKVTVESAVLDTIEVPLTVELTNQPKDIDIKTSAEPNKVRVAGPDEKVLQKLAEQKIKLSIDYSELDNSLNEIDKSITLPDGDEYKDCKIIPGDDEKQAPTTAKIKVDLHDYSAKEITANITKTEDDNYYYVFLPSTAKNLKICGSEDELDKIVPKTDITIEPDFSDKLNDMEPGQTVSLQNIPLKITLSKDYTESWVSGKYTIDEVRVTKKYK